MSDEIMNQRGSARAARLCAALVAIAVLVAYGCALVQSNVASNEWDADRWGPLVPHKSFPGDCSVCHRSDGWDQLRDDFSFDHEKETGVALVGAHAGAACLRCHNDRGPVSLYMARGCAGCHVDPHESSLGSDCRHCHGELNWQPTGLIAHHARTRFPLTGVHLGTACDRCHVGARIGDFKGAPVACHLCHQSDVARATNPNHVMNGFTRNCQQCHAPTGWSPAFFNHNTFPLTGAHATTICTQCHQNGRYQGTPRDCYSCHQGDYQQAQNPNHVSANFPRSCEVCHNTTAWRPASFDHSMYFPITSGDHKNLSCTDCHRTPNNYKSFSCIHCHDHRKTKMDDKHKDVSGYVYSSSACYQCHPRGK